MDRRSIFATDLIQHLGRRVSVLTDYQLPITTTSERLLVAIEATNAKAVAAAIAKLMKNDPTVRRRNVNGQIIFEFVEDDTAPPAAPQISFGDAPAVTPAHPAEEKEKGKGRRGQRKNRRNIPCCPMVRMTVWKGHLLIASHIDFLLKMVAPAKKIDPLRRRRGLPAGRQADPDSSNRKRNACDRSRVLTRSIAPPMNWSARTRCRRARRCWHGC